jgi:hypothetical protein
MSHRDRSGSPASIRIRVVGTCCGLALTLLTLCAVAAEQKAAPAQATYDSLKLLPDWSGWWGLEGPLSAEFGVTSPPWKPELAAAIQKISKSNDGGFRGLYCRPSEFTGYSGGFVESVEFLFTPGRVTLTNESGLIRRIYTDGRTSPVDVDPSTTGTSVGRWEGQTLVVETSGIKPTALYPQPAPSAVPVGRNVRIVERISLRDPQTLQFEITMTAPDIFTTSDQRMRIYSRVPKRIAAQISFCTDFDRAIDPDTGKQRFDLTAPADLPPPPPR